MMGMGGHERSPTTIMPFTSSASEGMFVPVNSRSHDPQSGGDFSPLPMKSEAEMIAEEDKISLLKMLKCVGPLVTVEATQVYNICTLDVDDDDRDTVWALVQMRFVRSFMYIGGRAIATGCGNVLMSAKINTERQRRDSFKPDSNVN